MGSPIHQPAHEAGGVNATYDRLAGLLREQPPERLDAFWEELPTMGKKRAKRPASETLAGSIKARIKALGLTAYALGKSSGVSAVVIQRFLNGERGITLETAEKLCGALDLVLVPRGNVTTD